MFLDQDREQRGPQQFVSHARSTGGIGVGQQQNEFVASQARHRVLFTHGRLQAGGEFNQHLITDAVTQGIVDVLEMVQVQKHQGYRMLRALGGAQGVLAAVAQ